jgi:dihydroorotate dehydrogenase
VARAYRVERSYDWNYRHGPRLTRRAPSVPATPLKDFLGYPVRSRLGIAAGLLLNARWIRAYAARGYDILTYKTVRSAERVCYALPNWVFLDPGIRVRPDEARQRFATVARPKAGAEFSSVSFGMPSKAPRVWMPDVARARAALGRGQVLVVSVVASPGAGASAREIVGDFADLAAMAREAGAHIVEANLSCPNVLTPEAQIYQDADLSKAIGRAMTRAVTGLPVALKIGHLATGRPLDGLLRALAGELRAVTMVNGFSRPVMGQGNRPAYGKGREAAGILGANIFEPCAAMVESAMRTIRREALGLEVIAVGGVFGEAQAARYFRAGAAAVTMGSAPMFDPDLAIRLKHAHPEW